MLAAATWRHQPACPDGGARIANRYVEPLLPSRNTRSRRGILVNLSAPSRTTPDCTISPYLRGADKEKSTSLLVHSNSTDSLVPDRALKIML
jgi:hypothetical protein